MGWSTAQVESHERHWPLVERWLSTLPPELGRRAKLLEYDLALRFGDTGRTSDIFLGPDRPPVTALHFWLLDDWTGTQADERANVDGALFLTAFLLIARRHTVERSLDAASFHEPDQVALVQVLSEHAVGSLQSIAPAAAFWDAQLRISTEEAESTLLHHAWSTSESEPMPPEAALGPGWSPTMRLLGAAAASVSRRVELIPRLDVMIEAIGSAFEILAELETMHADLLQGRMTYPIAFVVGTAQLPFVPRPAVERVLTAMAITRSVEPLLRDAIARLRRAQAISKDMALPTLDAFLDEAVERLESRLPGSRIRSARPSAPLIAIAEPALAKAVAMAEGFLTTDLTFRESWETHREGMLGAPEVASRFPAGLVLDLLSDSGLDLSAPIDGFLDFCVENGFRYYDHADSAADTDTIGVCLRLLRHSSEPRRHADELRRIVAAVAREVERTGKVPVWIPAADRPRQPVIDLGEGCGTVAGHLLLGLVADDPAGNGSVIERGGAGLVSRIRDVGVGANINYLPTYAIAIWLRLLPHLVPGDPSGEAAAAELAVRHARSGLVGRPMRTAQAAALATIACAVAPQTDSLDPSWMATILKQQRFDGSWIGEPFAAAPNRGRAVTWYSSSILTSALCHRALRIWAREGARPAGVQSSQPSGPA